MSDVGKAATRSTSPRRAGRSLLSTSRSARSLGARERAADADVHVHWLVGDVTNLGTLAAPAGYSLIYDLGCIQGLPDEAAALAAAGITSLAAEDATLLFLAFARGRRMICRAGWTVTTSRLSSALAGV
jgi:hypothetical protein